MVSSDHYHSVAASEAEWSYGLGLSHLCSFVDEDVSEEVPLQEASQVGSCQARGDKKETILLWVSSDVALNALNISIVPLELRVVKAVLSDDKCIDVGGVPTLLEVEERFEKGIGRHTLLSAHQDSDERGRLLEKESHGDGKDSCLTGAKGPSYEHRWTRRRTKCYRFQSMKLVG